MPQKAMPSLKGGRKLRRCRTKAPQYAAQWTRTAKHKAKRIRAALALTTSESHKAFLNSRLNAPYLGK